MAVQVLALGAQHNLAILFRRQDKLNDAESLLRETLNGQRRTVGEFHSKTLGTLDQVLQQMERFDEARALLDDHHQRARAERGYDDVVSIRAAIRLAARDEAAGCRNEAIALLREVHPIAEAALGDTADTRKINKRLEALTSGE